jgi:hypothetical protein
MSGTTVKEYHSETYKSEETKEEIIWLKQKFIWKTNKKTPEMSISMYKLEEIISKQVEDYPIL